MNKKLSEAKQRLFQQMISADHVELNEHGDDRTEDRIGICGEESKEKNKPP